MTPSVVQMLHTVYSQFKTTEEHYMGITVFTSLETADSLILPLKIRPLKKYISYTFKINTSLS